MSSSYGSKWPGKPNFTAGLMSQDVYANPVTPLTVIGGGGGGGGGTLPANVPVTTPGAITSTSIEISFDVAGVTGSQPITYDAAYSATSGGPYQAISLSPPVGTVYTGSQGGLTPNTTYYFVVVALNAVGQTTSTEIPITTSAGGAPPGNVPNAQFLSATTTSVTTYIDIAGVTGDTPITYGGFFGYSPGAWISNMFYTLSSGTIYTSGAFAQPSNTTIYFETTAQNASGLVSTIAPFPAYSTLSGAPTAPTAPGAPQVFLANNGSLISTLYFDVAGVTGTAPITYDMFWTNTNVPEILSTTTNLSSGTIYTGVVNDLPTNNGTYQIFARATNAAGNANSDNTVVFGSTIAGPVTAIPSTMSIGIGGVSQTAISLSTDVLLSGNPQPEIVAKFGIVSSSLISTTTTFDLISYYPIALSTVIGLPSSTTFYFNSVAYNSFGSTINTTVTAISTLSA